MFWGSWTSGYNYTRKVRWSIGFWKWNLNFRFKRANNGKSRHFFVLVENSQHSGLKNFSLMPLVSKYRPGKCWKWLWEGRGGYNLNHGKLAPPYHPVKCWTKTERDFIVGAFPRFRQLHVSIWSFITSDIPLFSDGPFMGLMGLLWCCDV